MLKKNWDVLIIGAGFVGNYTALSLANRDLDVLVIERKHTIGEPRHCAGLISVSGLQRLHLLKPLATHNLILNKIHNAILTGYRGTHKILSGEQAPAYVVNRVQLDQFLYQQAKKAGATYLLNTQASTITREGTVYTRGKQGESNTFTAQVIVDAEGPTRTLLKSFPDVRTTQHLPGFQIDIQTEQPLLPAHTVEIFFNVPDFFSWIIPLNTQTYRFGVATKHWQTHIPTILRQLIHQRTKEYTKLREFGGLVLAKGPLKRHVWGKIIALGDAGGWVKPTTGGGVVFGGLTANLAANIIEDTVKHNTPLHRFEQEVQPYMSEFTMMQLARNTLNFLGPNGIEVFLSLLPQTIFSKMEGDYDLQFKTLVKFLCPLLLLS